MATVKQHIIVLVRVCLLPSTQWHSMFVHPGFAGPVWPRCIFACVPPGCAFTAVECAHEPAQCHTFHVNWFGSVGSSISQFFRFRLEPDKLTGKLFVVVSLYRAFRSSLPPFFIGPVPSTSGPCPSRRSTLARMPLLRISRSVLRHCFCPCGSRRFRVARTQDSSIPVFPITSQRLWLQISNLSSQEVIAMRLQLCRSGIDFRPCCCGLTFNVKLSQMRVRPKRARVFVVCRLPRVKCRPSTSSPRGTVWPLAPSFLFLAARPLASACCLLLGQLLHRLSLASFTC